MTVTLMMDGQEITAEEGKTLLEVAREKHCGTVVVGYAAFSWFQELLHRHLAEILLQKAAGIALWIVH